MSDRGKGQVAGRGAPGGARPAGGAWILAIDTATSAVVVAAGSPDGELIAARSFPAEHRHGERLLAEVERLIGEAGVERPRLAGVVVGIGPGAFTGLRVGLATAKTLAHGLGLPIAGVSTGRALAAAAEVGDADAVTVLLPAGPHDRVAVEGDAPPRLLPGGEDPAADGRIVVAVDLDGRAPAAALRLGERARGGLAASLVRLGTARLADGGDDVETLVPEYVTLPRGVLAATAAGPRRESGGEGIAWSRDPR